MDGGPVAQAEETALAADAEPSSRDAIMSTTRAGIVSSWNRPAVLLDGYLAEDLIGRASEVLWSTENRTQESETRQRVLAGGPGGAVRRGPLTGFERACGGSSHPPQLPRPGHLTPSCPLRPAAAGRARLGSPRPPARPVRAGNLTAP
jgi:PAS fold